MVNPLKLSSLEYAELIANNEIREIDWYNILDTFEFSYLLAENDRLLNSYYFRDDDYTYNVTQLFRAALNDDKENALELIKFLLENYTNCSYDELDNNSSFNHEMIDKCFISYSHVNREIAHIVKTKLEEIGISSFLAHEDIECSQEWQSKILEELNNVDLFIPLLSKNFNESYFCSQEVGIAIFRKILIIPLSLDGTKPEGFLGKIQSKKFNGKDIKMIIDILINNSPNCMINKLITQLNSRNSYKYCSEIFKYLEDHFDSFNKNNVIDLVKVSIKNNQIHNSYLCKKSLSEFFEINKDKIPKDLIDDFFNKCIKYE